MLPTLLAAIAEFERELILERKGKGRNRAMANGVKFGRKPKLSAYRRAEAIKRRAAGETLAIARGRPEIASEGGHEPANGRTGRSVSGQVPGAVGARP